MTGGGRGEQEGEGAQAKREKKLSFRKRLFYWF